MQHLSLDQLEAIEEDIHHRLDLDFSEPRVQALAPAEQDLLLHSGQVPNRVRKGQYEYTAPKLYEFLQRRGRREP